MTSRDLSARSSTDRLVALFAPVIVALPWIILFLAGWHLYLYVLVGFALIMLCLNRRELAGRVRNWRAARKSKELRKAA
jgi:cobalamin biosynthesis protein CobD/CbiB